MSQETMSWLNTMTLQGFTLQRGNAWHYMESEQGTEPNHYPGAIPREDVERRLFYWVPVMGDVQTNVILPCVRSTEGKASAACECGASAGQDHREILTTITDPDRVTVVHPETRKIMNVRDEGYRIHGYQEWLLDDVALLQDGGLQISSAGLLRGGAVAWVQVQLPESVDTPEGLTGRPYLLAATSLDSSLATGYTRGAQLVVCDNTLAIARRDGRAFTIKFKHTSGSLGKRALATRGALDLITEAAEDFQEEVRILAATPVTEAQWQAWLDLECPLPEAKSADKPGKAYTMAEKHRETLATLWNHDDRVSPWKGTALGVVQAANTYAHHEAIVRGMARPERNALNMVTGKAAALDLATMDRLDMVLAA